jgi:hypothetical protein
MKTVSVSSRKAAHCYLSANFDGDCVICFPIDNRSFVHFLNVLFFQYKSLFPASGFDSFIYSGMKTDLVNRS